MKQRNPFIYNAPVAPDRFIGRAYEVDQILSYLANPAARVSSAISGDPRVGKTSLLHYLRTHQVREAWELSPSWCHFLYLDCHSIAPFSEATFWRYTLRELEQHISDDETLRRSVQRLLEQPEIETYDLNSLFDQIAQVGRLVVLMLDEFEGVVENLDQRSPELLYHLRALLNRPERGLALLVATRAPLKQLCAGFHFAGSPFDNAFLAVTLPPFSEAEVDELLGQYQADFSVAERTFLRQMAGTHPYLVQLAGWFIVQAHSAQAGAEISLDQIEADLEHETEGYFLDLLDYSSEREKMLLAWLALSQLSQQLPADEASLKDLTSAFKRYDQEIAGLVKRGLVLNRSDGPTLFSPIFGWWVLRKVIIARGREVISDWEPDYASFLSPAQKETLKNLMDKVIRQPAIIKTSELLAQVSAQNELGHLLLEKYQFLEPLGTGGWGDVYKALDLKLGREVAIKHLKADLTKDEVALERFLREAKTIASLRHPSIVTIHALERDGDDHYIVMEYAGQGTLEDLLEADGPLSIDQSVDIAIAVCQALELVHSKEIIHRDIKPSNILLFADVEGNLTPKLADFGVARTSLSRQDRPLTSEGLVVGTFNYMSPEQLKGEVIDARSDVYGMGLVLYQMLTGDLPYVSSALDLLLTTRNIVPPTKKRENIPEVLEQIIMKALSVNSAKRFPTARAMAEALESFRGIKSSAYTWAKLEALYAAGIGHLERGELQESISKLRQLASIDTTFRDVQDKLKSAEEGLELEELYKQGLRHFENEEWRDAADCFGQIITREPDFKDAEQKWKGARQREGLQIEYARGLRYFEQKRWEDAAATFQDIVDKAPDYLDAKDRLAHANQRINLNALYERATVGIQASRWQEAIQALEQIVELDATYRNAAELLKQARLEEDLQSSYQEGVEHFMRKNWHAALESFQRVQNIRPEYKDAVEFLRRASEQADLEDLYEKGQEYQSTEQWQQAREVYLRLLTATGGEYRDADKRLADVNDQIHVEANFAKGRDAFEKEQWLDAIRLLENVLEQKPDHRKSIELLTEARVQQKLRTLYDQAIAHEAAAKWGQAVETWEQITETSPNYRNAAEQLSRARQRQRIESLYEEGWKYLRDENSEKAVERFEQVLDLDPDHQGAIASKEEAKKLKLYDRDTEVKTAFIGLLGVIFSTLFGTLGAVFLSYWLNHPGHVPSPTPTIAATTSTPASALIVTTSMPLTVSHAATTTTLAPDLPDYLISSLAAVLNTPLVAALLGGLIAALAALVFNRFLVSAMMSIAIRTRRASRGGITLTGTKLARLRPLAFVLALIIAVYLLIKIMSVLGRSIDYLSLLSHPAWQGVAALIALVALVFQEDIRKLLEKPGRKRFIYLIFLSLLFLSAFIAADSSIPTPTAPPTPLPSPTPPLVAETTVSPTPTSTNTPINTSTSTSTPTPTGTPTPLPPTATLTPTPTPPPTPEAIVVAATGLNLRFGPGTIYDPPIGYLRSGDILDITGRITNNEWIQVTSVNLGIGGWVCASPEYVQINVDLDTIPIVESLPPRPLAPAPTLLEPPNGTSVGIQTRLDLAWTWNGTLGPDDYYQVEIWNRYNDFGEPIDVAWVKGATYKYDKIEEAYSREYRWRITVVRGEPKGEKCWSTLENPVWEPGKEGEFEPVSKESEIWALFVEPGTETPPGPPEPEPPEPPEPEPPEPPGPGI